MWVSRERFSTDFRREEKEKSDFRQEDDKEKRAWNVSMARGGTGLMGSMRRLSLSCYVYQDRILPGLLPEGGCGSCAPT